MKLTLRGVEYKADVLDLYEVSIAEARTIKRNTGMTIQDWRIGLMTIGREDPDVLAALVFLLMHRAQNPDDPEIDWREIGSVTSKEINEGAEWEDSDAEALKRVRGETGGEDAEQPTGTEEPEPADADEQQESAIT